MPTTVVKTIGSGGGRDYATPLAWYNACKSTYTSGLVAADVIWKGELYNDSEFTTYDYGDGVTTGVYAGDEITTDSTRYLWLTTAAGQSFRDSSGIATAPLRYDQSKGVAFRATANYASLLGSFYGGTQNTKMVVENIQFYFDKSYSSNYFLMAYGAGGSQGFVVNNCLFETRSTGIPSIDASCDKYINCIIVQRGATFSSACIVGAASAEFRNCTIVRPSDLGGGGYGVTHWSGAYPLIVNCAVFGFTTAFDGTIASYPGGCTNNASDASTANIPGGSDQGSLTFSNQFQLVTDSARDWRPKSGGALNTNGTRDQTNTNDLDIIGAARSTSTPTIGAREFSASGPAVPVLVSGRNYRMSNWF